MSIKQYEENGKSYFGIYINVMSSSNPSIRVQKRKYRIPTYSEAVKEKNKLLKEATKQLGQLEERGMCWGKVIELWYEEQCKLGESSGYSSKVTLTDYESMLRRHTFSWLKKNPQDLTRADGKEIILSLKGQGKSRSFIQKVKSTINLVYQWGVDNRFIKWPATSPVYGIKLEKKEEKFPEILNLVEIRKFLLEAKKRDHSWYTVWAMALLTGMRSGELFALEWDDVDFDNQLVRVKKSFNKRTNEIKSTKAGYWRNIPISTELHSLLVQLKSSTGKDRWVLPRLPEWLRGEQAKPLRSFLREIGLPSVKFHTLRACFATQLLADGVEVSKVMKIGGWQDLETMQIYLRLAGVDEKGATENLRFLPSDEAVMNRVVSLFEFKK